MWGSDVMERTVRKLYPHIISLKGNSLPALDRVSYFNLRLILNFQIVDAPSRAPSKTLLHQPSTEDGVKALQGNYSQLLSRCLTLSTDSDMISLYFT